MTPLPRRDFFRAGALGIGGLLLADVLRLRAETGARRKPKSVIMVCLNGGPSHIDSYDLKPAAPADIRGEFRPIKTRVPGFDICELMPLQAKIADQLAVVRTVQFVEPNQHELQEVYSGFPKAAKRPCFGSLVSRFGTGHDPRLPRYVTLDGHVHDLNVLETPHYLGSGHEPFVYEREGFRNLHPARGVVPNRLNERKLLLKGFDGLRRDLDIANRAEAMDAFTEQAMGILTSPKARQAFDLSREPTRVRDLYRPDRTQFIYGDQPATMYHNWWFEKFLLARRLVEAGVSVVTMRVGSWDYHGAGANGTGSLFVGMKSQLPLLDRSIYALVSDLKERGLDKDVLVLVWGEFGRSPKINNLAGRDHWPEAGFALFAGGGLKMGQVVGETDAKAARPKNSAVNAQNVLATVYHALGIDPSLEVRDFGGRPRALLDNPEPIKELI